MRRCPSCGGKHRKLSAARKCYRRHHEESWNLKEMK